MITHELAKIWITSDGKRFIDKQKAILHEEDYQKEQSIYDKAYQLWSSNSHKL
jgi:hypothetical protein